MSTPDPTTEAAIASQIAYLSDAVRKTESLEWLRNFVEDAPSRVRDADLAMLKQVADEFATARYEMWSKAQTLDYVTRLHREANVTIRELRAQVAALGGRKVA